MLLGANVICGFTRCREDHETAALFRSALVEFCQRHGLEADASDIHPDVEAYTLGKGKPAVHARADDLLLAGTAHPGQGDESWQGAYAMAWTSRLSEGKTELYLQRDPMGIGSLYTLRRGRSVCFSSSMDFLARLIDHPTLNLHAVVESICLSSLQEAHTWFNEVQSLPPGQTLCIQLHGDGFKESKKPLRGPETFTAPKPDDHAEAAQIAVNLQNADPLAWEAFFLSVPTLASDCRQAADFRLEAFLLHQTENAGSGIVDCNLGLRDGRAPLNEAIVPPPQAAYPLFSKTLKKRVSAKNHIGRSLDAALAMANQPHQYFNLFSRWPAALNRTWEIAQLRGQHWRFPRLQAQLPGYTAGEARRFPELDLDSQSTLPQPDIHTKSCTNVFDAAQRLYRMGSDKNFSNHLFRLQPPVTAKLARRHRRTPNRQYGDLAIRLLTADYLLGTHRFVLSDTTTDSASHKEDELSPSPMNQPHAV
ncbi:hypothetical protein QQM79_18680 [Marinobacteraceae bacterium S3BR75-40.1]